MHQRYQDTIGSSWTADPRPASLFALFLRVPQAEPFRRQDNGSYPLSAEVQTQVHIWVPPTVIIVTNDTNNKHVKGDERVSRDALQNSYDEHVDNSTPFYC